MSVKGYLLAQIKRILHLLPWITGLGLVMLFLLLAAGRVLVKSSAYEQDQARYSIGIITEGDNSMIDLGMFYLEKYDDSRYMLQITRYDNEEQAFDALYAGEITACFQIPEDFFDSINELTNDSVILYYTRASADGITELYTEALTEVVAGSILYSEEGIFTLMDYMNEKGYAAEAIYAETDKLFLKYVDALVDRGKLVEVRELGLGSPWGAISGTGAELGSGAELGTGTASGSATIVSTYEYFFAGLSLFYILMLGLGAAPFFLGQKPMLMKLAAAEKVGPAAQVLCEYGAFGLGNLVTLGIAAVPVALLAGDYVPADVRSLIPDLLLGMLLLGASEFMIYEVARGTLGRILISFILALAAGYASGLLYPSYILPLSLQRAGALLPTGVALSTVLASIAGTGDGRSQIFEVLYTAAILALACVARHRKTHS